MSKIGIVHAGKEKEDIWLADRKRQKKDRIHDLIKIVSKLLIRPSVQSSLTSEIFRHCNAK
jgi:hypothetical protein